MRPGGKKENNWLLRGSGNWYDFTILLDAQTGFERKFVGRLETGKHSVSDPAMTLKINK